MCYHPKSAIDMIGRSNGGQVRVSTFACNVPSFQDVSLETRISCRVSPYLFLSSTLTSPVICSLFSLLFYHVHLNSLSMGIQ